MNFRFVAVFLLSALPLSSFAVLPENGLYWDSSQPGKGFYIEVQNNIGVVVIDAGSPSTGKPEYYIAAGPIGESGILEDPQDFGGFYPVNGFNGDLYALSQAPCLTCYSVGMNDVEYKVGTVQVAFGDRNNVAVVIDWNGPIPPLTGSQGELAYYLRREDFAYPLLRDGSGKDWYYNHDLRGEWIFIDETDPMRSPWRFQFTQVTPTIDMSYKNEQIPAFDYVDPIRNATLHCIAGFGCSLSVNGQQLFAMREGDIGLDSILAYLGPFKYPLSGVYRGTQTVIGMRIPPQPAQTPLSP